MNVDMNAELKGHGISNLISGITGGVPNYLCYSSSVTYFKCNGGSKYVLYVCLRGCTCCTVLHRTVSYYTVIYCTVLILVLVITLTLKFVLILQ